jgi:predicted nucleotidyltransferase
MRLNTNLTEIFDSPAKIKLIKYIIKPGFMMTGREAARICAISASRAINILKVFENINMVSSRRAGKSVVWTARPESYAFFVADRFFGKFNLFSAAEHLKQILKDWAKSKNKYVQRVILFGSVAEGTDNSSSDIDLFVEIKGPEHKEKIEKSLEDLSLNCIKLYGNVLNPYILTKKELFEKKESGLLKNIEKGIKIL